jgi:hypothetical protein
LWKIFTLKVQTDNLSAASPPPFSYLQSVRFGSKSKLITVKRASKYPTRQREIQYGEFDPVNDFDWETLRRAHLRYWFHIVYLAFNLPKRPMIGELWWGKLYAFVKTNRQILITGSRCRTATNTFHPYIYWCPEILKIRYLWFMASRDLQELEPHSKIYYFELKQSFSYMIRNR